jgi:F-type H+-transporting ATPase subunit delta
MAALAGSVARRYARALFQIGVDTGTFEALGQELGDLAQLFQDSTELRQTLVNPVFKPAEKRAILEKILPRVTPNPIMQRFALLLLDRGRIVLLAWLARAYRELADAHAGRVRAVVTSATPLSPADLERVRKSLERRTKKTVMLEAQVDPNLIGGLVAQVGDLVLDGSVRTQLSTLRDKLLN